MGPVPPRTQLRLRSVFISDVHPGFNGCRAGFLLDFLQRVDCEYLYLVGDIIDLWSLERTLYWPRDHNDVVRAVLGKARRGTRVVYVPGNHDRVFRDYDGRVPGNFERATACEARRRGLDGLVCGHIHRAELRDIEGVLYCNDGDWVESCTALVEDAHGRLSVLRWTEQLEVLSGDASLSAAALGQAA